MILFQEKETIIVASMFYEMQNKIKELSKL